MTPVETRVAQAEQILRELGIEGRVWAAGAQGEIASLAIPGAEWERLLGEPGARLAERIRALGFRYVALDLAPEGGGL